MFDGMGLAGLSAGSLFFYWPGMLALFWSTTVFAFSSFFLWVGIVGLGSLD